MMLRNEHFFASDKKFGNNDVNNEEVEVWLGHQLNDRQKHFW